MNYLSELNLVGQKAEVMGSLCSDCDSDDKNDDIIVDNGINTNKDYTCPNLLYSQLAKIFLHSLFHLILI